MGEGHVPAVRVVAAVGAAAGLVLLSGMAALAGPAGSVEPAARLCLAEGQPVLGARSDGNGGFVCPSGRSLVEVPAQEAVRLLDAAVDDLTTRAQQLEQADVVLRGQLEQLRAATAVTHQQTGVPFSVAPGATTPGTSTSTMSCGSSGKALSGSARTQNATLVQSHLLPDGVSWRFVIRPTSSSPSAETLLVCAGPTGSGSGGPRPGVASG